MGRRRRWYDAGFTEAVVSSEENAFVETNGGIHDVVQNRCHQGVIGGFQARERALQRRE